MVFYGQNGGVAIRSAIGGLIVSGLGIVWALTIDALTFVVLAASISSLNLPKHRVTMEKEQRSMMADLRQGWRVIVAHPIVRPLVMTTMIVNIAAFLGPLYPQLVDERLDGSATAFGLIGAASALASIVAGLSVGLLDTKVGAGRLTAFSWMVAGLCTGIVGVSTSLPLTLLFDGLVGYSVTIGSIASGALSTLLIPSEYRGRAFGIMQSLAVLSIPPSALVGGWASDQFGVTPLFLVGGGIFLFAGLLVLLHPAMRTATVNTPQS